MKIEDIEQRLASFYDGQTSPQEEEELYLYLLETDQLPQHLLREKEIFVKLYESKDANNIEIPEGLESRISNLIDNLSEEKEIKPKKKIHSFWLTSGVAAMLVIALTFAIDNYKDHKTNNIAHQDTFNTPEEASKAVEEALILASSKAEKGFEQLEMMNKILNKASNNDENDEQ